MRYPGSRTTQINSEFPMKHFTNLIFVNIAIFRYVTSDCRFEIFFDGTLGALYLNMINLTRFEICCDALVFKISNLTLIQASRDWHRKGSYRFQFSLNWPTKEPDT
ncbi:hypothetical protein AYI69_g3841 [Smittium culicis]|uniref:Uncharacterized protein n=1 Tax=Smittium culicis TaxID=133412 RepID=A0A1R1YIJ3_9FUNG|nr:hypothetical protein AYI69_g3841 [Smittium culicis]